MAQTDRRVAVALELPARARRWINPHPHPADTPSMAIAISELRPTEIEDALAFIGEHGAHPARAQIRGSLSLIARLDDAIVGAVIHTIGPARQRHLQLALAGPDQLPADHADAENLARTLIDKALLKMRTDGITTARIQPLGDGVDQQLWGRCDWLTRLQPTG